MDIQFKKGILDTCILYTLKDGESYGYKIISDLSDVIVISESTLYPILKRLENGGYLTTYNKIYNGRTRRYYAITHSGREKLTEGKKDFEELMKIYKNLFGKGAKL